MQVKFKRNYNPEDHRICLIQAEAGEIKNKNIKKKVRVEFIQEGND